MAFGSWIVVAAVLILARMHPSPWLSDSLIIFLHPPPPLQVSQHRLALSTSSSSPPVYGCQDLLTTQSEERENAAIVLLLREQDLDELLPTLENFEHRFNSRFRYPFVFLTSPVDPPFSANFRQRVGAVLPSGAITEWAVVEDEYWRIPKSMDVDEVRRGFAEQEKAGVQYAGREGYHHMCRFYSGLWVKTAALQKYDWYWRLEPGVRFYCTVTYDPFRFMALNNKLYGFVITIVENLNTIPTLFDAVTGYIHREGLKPGSRMWDFMTRGNGSAETYSGCHFWSNFEIGDLRFFRSAPYQRLFEELDRAGGFYAERWGDAPIRSIALGVLADVDRIHYFEDFAYQHDWFMHCPKRPGLGCDCECPAYSKHPLPQNELTDIDNDWRFSCLDRWKASAIGSTLPNGTP